MANWTTPAAPFILCNTPLALALPTIELTHNKYTKLHHCLLSLNYYLQYSPRDSFGGIISSSFVWRQGTNVEDIFLQGNSMRSYSAAVYQSSASHHLVDTGWFECEQRSNTDPRVNSVWLCLSFLLYACVIDTLVWSFDHPFTNSSNLQLIIMRRSMTWQEGDKRRNSICFCCCYEMAYQPRPCPFDTHTQREREECDT
jgi:hypothetical protein